MESAPKKTPEPDSAKTLPGGSGNPSSAIESRPGDRHASFTALVFILPFRTTLSDSPASRRSVIVKTYQCDMHSSNLGLRKVYEKGLGQAESYRLPHLAVRHPQILAPL